MKIFLRVFAPLSIVSVLLACTESEDLIDRNVEIPSISQPQAIPDTGVLTDAPIQGVSYETATQSGVTDAMGQFQYLPGETVTFSIGGTQIGAPAAAASTMTPSDLVPNLVLYNTSAQVEAALRDPAALETVAFIRLVNILVFLQSLDDDADPTNGISIPTGIDVLLAGVQIDFDADPDDFRNASGLGPILDQAVGQGLLITARIADHARAMDHYYSSQGITITALRMATREVDNNLDGNTDGVVRFSYDAVGNLVEEAADDNNDGTPESITSFTYDQYGNRTSEEKYVMGALGSSSTYAFDSNGCQILREDDFDGDAVLDVSVAYTVEVNCRILGHFRDRYRNGMHSLSRTTRMWTDDDHWIQEYDDGDDGTVDAVEHFQRTREADGSIIEASRFDLDNDGTIDSVERNTIDARGDHVLYEVDINNNGTVDGLGTFEFIYDAEGFLVEESATYWLGPENPDPYIGDDSVVQHEYDTDGLLERSIFSVTDPLGTREFAWTYQYEAGNWVSALNFP